MKVTCNGIKNGILDDKYGKRGKEQMFGMPTRSIPIKIEDAPKGTKSFALIFDDPESISVKKQGFIWIHWLACNITKTEIKENESLNTYDFIQGKNSWNENCYGGPCPPDKPHHYRLRVYALDSMLNLRGDFYLSQLEKEMEGKILDSSEISALYSN